MELKVNFTNKIIECIDPFNESIEMHNDNVRIIMDTLKDELSEERYLHTLGVAFTATSLAMRYGAHLYSAHYAGLLHDCAKTKLSPKSEDINYCRQLGIEITKTEQAAPQLLHAKLGAYRAENVFGIKDADIKNAILTHTTGCTAMTLLQKIIYMADYIEPGRTDKVDAITTCRDIAFKDIDEAIYICANSSIEYLSSIGSVIDETTLAVRDYYKKLVSSKTV